MQRGGSHPVAAFNACEPQYGWSVLAGSRDALAQGVAQAGQFEILNNFQLKHGRRVAEGLERSRKARWRHGFCSRETREFLAAGRRRRRELLVLLEAL